MSALIGPAKAARILAETLVAQAEAAEAAGDSDAAVDTLLRLGLAYGLAGERMEQEMREEAQSR